MAGKKKLILGVSDFISTKGRLDRLTYLVNGMGINALTLLFVYMQLGINNFISEDSPYALLISVHYGSLLFIICLCYLGFCLAAKRLHDIGWPGWPAILLFADNLSYTALWAISPFYEFSDTIYETRDSFADGYLYLVIAASLFLLFKAGQKGENKYGTDPQGYYKPPKPQMLEG